LIPGEIRVFATIETQEARAWITARPGSRADSEATSAPPARVARTRRARRPPREWAPPAPDYAEAE
jgi:hypothetical protein